MTDWYTLAVSGGASLLAITVFLAFVRLIKGPTFPDRVVALDIMATVAIGMIALYALKSGEVIFLDVALIVALVTFLGTVAFAYYVERRQIKTGSTD
ncbi:MAG: cation:proton antiporter [Syntrophobacteraceae bacterium]